MKSSDVEKAVKERNGTATPAPPKKGSNGAVDYRATTIAETQGARESDPLQRAKLRPGGSSKAKRSVAQDRNGSRKVLHDVLDEFLDDEESAGDSASDEPAEEFDFDALQKALDAIAADESLERMTTEVFARSVAKDAAPRPKLCHCCGNLGGLQAWNRAHRVI